MVGEQRRLWSDGLWQRRKAGEKRRLPATRGQSPPWSLDGAPSSSSNSMEQQPQAQVIKAEEDCMELQALAPRAPSVKAKEEVVPQALAIKYEAEEEVPQALTKRQKKRKRQAEAKARHKVKDSTDDVATVITTLS